MAATRRDVLKTTVVSAFGLMASGSIAKAADFYTKRAVVRATVKDTGSDVDLLLDGSSGTLYAYYPKTPPAEGDVLEDVQPKNGFAAPGDYIIATSKPGESYPSLTVKNDGSVKFDHAFANAWNEIGSRKNQLKSHHGKPPLMSRRPPKP
jgi:hypothetical protein